MKKLPLIGMILFCCAPAFAQTWGTLNVDLVVPMNTSSPGTTLTAAIEVAGTSSNACTPSTSSGSTNCQWGTVPSGMTVGANQNASSNLGAVQLTSGGTLYPAQSLNGNTIQVDDTNLNFINTLTFGSSVVTTGNFGYLVLMSLGWPHQVNGNDFDSAMICSSSCSHYDVVQFTNSCDGSTFIVGARIHHDPSTASNCTHVFNQQSEYISVRSDSTNHMSCEWVFTPQGTFVPNDVNAASHPETCYSNTVGTINAVRLPSNESLASSGNFSQYQNVMFQWSTAAPTGTATFTNGSATVTGSGLPTDHSWDYGVFNLSGTSYMIATCSGGGGTTCTMVTTFTGTTGSASYAVELPLFWTRTDAPAGLVAPTRSALWPKNGVPGGIPTTRVQCVTTQCGTVTTNGSSATEAQIEAALASAPANTYVLLGSGTFSIPCISFSAISNVTLRGAGANNTIISTSSSCGTYGINVTGTNPNQSTATAVTGNVVQGANTISLASVGATLKVGNPIIIDQLDPITDLGGILVLGTQSSYTGSFTAPGSAGPYSASGEATDIRISASCTSASPANCYHQIQTSLVTQCDGNSIAGHTCSSGANITINPPLEMMNWSTANMFAWWSAAPITGDGVEDLDLEVGGVSGSNGVHLNSCVGCWVKGVKVSTTKVAHIMDEYGIFNTVKNNYLFMTQDVATASYGIVCQTTSHSLYENNIAHAVASPWMFNSSCHANIFAYNYNILDYYNGVNYNQNAEGDHSGGLDDNLFEGNLTNWFAGDDVHGTGNLQLYFRNAMTGILPLCYQSGSTSPFGSATYGVCNNPTNAIQICGYHRFYNAIANVMYNPNATTLISNATNNSPVIEAGAACSGGAADTQVQPTMVLWGNTDNVNGYGSPQYNCANVNGGVVYTSQPTSQAQLVNPCPYIQSFPASFYYSVKPGWWPSGTPWPPIGPDVSGGNLIKCSSGTYSGAYVNNVSLCAAGTGSSAFGGKVNSIPAMDCWFTLGGNPYGTNAVLTNFNEASCYTVGPPPNAANPTCAPGNLGGSYNSNIPLAINCSSSAGAIICFTTDGSTPGSINQSSSCPAGTTLYTTSITVSSSKTLQLIAGGPAYSDSGISSYSYVVSAISGVMGGHAVLGGTSIVR